MCEALGTNDLCDQHTYNLGIISNSQRSLPMGMDVSGMRNIARMCPRIILFLHISVVLKSLLDLHLSWCWSLGSNTKSNLLENQMGLGERIRTLTTAGHRQASVRMDPDLRARIATRDPWCVPRVNLSGPGLWDVGWGGRVREHWKEQMGRGCPLTCMEAFWYFQLRRQHWCGTSWRAALPAVLVSAR